MAGIPIHELSQMDLDDLEHLDHEGLQQHFRRLALRATPGQLREILNEPAPAADDGPLERRVLVDAYVSKYVGISMRLRRLQSGFSSLKPAEDTAAISPTKECREEVDVASAIPQDADPSIEEEEELGEEFDGEDEEDDFLAGPKFG